MKIIFQLLISSVAKQGMGGNCLPYDLKEKRYPKKFEFTLKVSIFCPEAYNFFCYERINFRLKSLNLDYKF